jgi:hypothetical protein
MDDLGFDFGNAVPWFTHEREQPYVLVRMTAQNVALLEAAMAEPLRRCYITDDALADAAARHGLTLSDVLGAKLPDVGATMAGDFGEVLGYFYQSVKEPPLGPRNGGSSRIGLNRRPSRMSFNSSCPIDLLLARRIRFFAQRLRSNLRPLPQIQSAWLSPTAQKIAPVG